MTDKWTIFDAMGVVFVVGDDTNELLVPFVQERVSNISRDTINCVFVDVRAKNLKSANDLGMKTVRFARNPDTNLFKPDREISDFRELSVVVEEIF